MPAGKGTYGSKVGRPIKKKTKKQGKVLARMEKLPYKKKKVLKKKKKK